MPKEKKPGWQYYKSEFFDEEFAIHIETGWVYFEKGAKYSPAEIKLMTDNGEKLDMATHKIKTIIGGELVAYERKGTDDKGKSVTGGAGKNPDNAKHTGGVIQGNTQSDIQSREGELEIW